MLFLYSKSIRPTCEAGYKIVTIKQLLYEIPVTVVESMKRSISEE